MRFEIKYGPGTYFFGDPTFALKRDPYDDEDENGNRPYENYNGVDLLNAMHQTEYEADEVLTDQYGHSYPVQSGTLALLPLKYEEVLRRPIKKLNKYGLVIVAKKFTRFIFQGGIFYVIVDDEITYEVDSDKYENYYCDLSNSN